MEGEPPSRPAVFYRHLERLFYELGAHVIGHGEADNTPGGEGLGARPK